MRKYALLLAILQGCSAVNVKAGFSFHAEASAEPEITNMPSPLGIVRAEYKTNKGNTFFAEHITSVPGVERGSGLNHAGFLFEF